MIHPQGGFRPDGGNGCTRCGKDCPVWIDPSAPRGKKIPHPDGVSFDSTFWCAECVSEREERRRS